MSEEYGTHADYMKWVKADADSRQQGIEETFRKAFSKFIETKEVEIIVFSSMTAFDLAHSIISYPLVLKPLLAASNIAARAIERDLSIKNVNTYNPKLREEQANVIAGYIKPFLPEYLELPALSQIDRVSFIDKEIRKRKGRWEQKVTESFNRFSKIPFHRRKFFFEGEMFELDAAFPKERDIEVGIDIKRIEARRDIHKRCDEIANKAFKLKSSFPKAKFGAVIYYPFIEEHINIQSRLRSENIDGVVFASESNASIHNAVKMLISTFEVPTK